MRFTRDLSSSVNLIRAYGGGELCINENRYQGAVIVSATTVVAQPDVHDLEGLLRVSAALILNLDPELVLLGTGTRQIFPDASFGAQFLREGIGFDVMDTGAASRTFNVLVGEQRRVVGLLLA